LTYHFVPNEASLGGPPVTENVSVTQTIRTLKGRNKACLVLASNGRRYVQKFLNRDGTDQLFNEALGSQLGLALGLSLPAWAELQVDARDCRPTDAGAFGARRPSTFGSELIPGDILEDLPGNSYRNVGNYAEVYRWLLFDLWCNHTDSRQIIFQHQGPRALHAYFVDHDRMFTPDTRRSLPERIEQTRYLDVRIYEASLLSLPDLLRFAGSIRSLVRKDLSELVKTVPVSWGSRSHREQVISGLQRRSNELDGYIEWILCFQDSLWMRRTSEASLALYAH
jgi:hypothetical protein